MCDHFWKMALTGLTAGLMVGCSGRQSGGSSDSSSSLPPPPGNQQLLVYGGGFGGNPVHETAQSIEISMTANGFQFSLDVNSGAVQNSSSQLVYQLSNDEQTQLAGMFNDSVYAGIAEILVLQGRGVPPLCSLLEPDYAVIVTNVESLHVQGDSCQDNDVYSLTTYQPVGLKPFLDTILQEIGIPNITGISERFGNIGDNVTLTGTGFTGSNNLINFGNGVVRAIENSDGTLTFIVPSNVVPACAYNPTPCPFAQIPVTAGTYNVSVTNSNGTSNTVQITVN